MTRLFAIVLAGAMLFIAPVLAFAAPAAGTVIGNQATATYNDAGGNSRTTTSNLVQTTVTQVKSFSLTANGARTAAPGQTVYYPHTITNTGNGTDTYTLNAPASTSFGAGPHTSLAYFIDANGDGVPDNGTPVNSSGAIAAGGTFRFVVAATVPAGAVSGNTATVTVSATDTTPTTLTNTDTTTVANSVINATKSFSSPSGTSPSGPITVTLSYTNTGSAAAANVQFTDVLNAAFTYVAGSGRWSVSGAAALTDTADGVEQAGAFPPGIDYRSSLGAGATVIALIPSVAPGASGNVTFQVNVNANLVPQTLNNTAQYQTTTQLSTNTNTASYQVLQGAAVVANGSNTISTNGTGEPVTIASAPAGSTFSFNNYVWNRGNGSDTFDMTITSNTFPPGTTVNFLQQDGATTLINSGGAAAPDTGPIPGLGQPCAAPFVSDTSTTPATCGYRVVVRVTLPSNAASGSYSIVKRATSVFNNAVFDEVTDTLASVAANTVDVTNDRAAPPAGAGVAGDGLASSGAAIVRTNAVTPGAAPVTTRFRIWITNSGLVADNFNLAAAFVASNAPGAAPPALPAGWSVALLADASGAPADCSAVGAPVASTGALAVGAGRLVCAEVTVPAAASGTPAPGNYDFDFTATSATNAAVSDVIRDRVAVAAVRNIAFAPNAAQQTFPNGTVVYSHTLTNNGTGVDTATFAAGCLSDSRAAQGWTSSAFIDANANGTFEIATDTLIACGTSSVTLNPGETRAIFVRVTAPAGATPADPADVATLTATAASPLPVNDSTTIITGLIVAKDQQALGVAGCSNNNPPAASYSQAAIAANPATVPGSCIAYRVTATNATAAPITGVTLTDVVPAGTRMHYACSGNGTATPSTTVGAMAASTPADNASGTVTANVGALAAGQSSVVYFCAQVTAAPGATIVNQANGSGTQSGNVTTAASNATTAVVGTPVGTTVSAVLAASQRVNGTPGATMYFRHTLTNTGTATDTYSLAAADIGSGWTFGGVAFFPDANGDGQPDGAVPLANPVTLAPGQVLQFVLRVVVPSSGFASNESRVRISATSTGGAAIAPVIDTVALPDPGPRDCAVAEKTLSRIQGPSPNPLVTVRITYNPCTEARQKLFISDRIPAGMRYVAGSGRWSVMGATVLSDGVVGDDRQGSAPQQITYDYNVTAPGTVTAWIYAIPANTLASISFNVEIDPGLAIGTAITNTAEYNFYSASGNYETRQFSSSTYTVDGTVDLTLTGSHVPIATPGTTITFTNVLTNRGTTPDTFDITLGPSTFPSGVVLALFKPDGVTPLADTDNDGTPDSGLLAPGASYNVVVKATLPESLAAGSYKVTKTARSANAPTRTVSVDDVVDAVAQRCLVTLDPDNQALIGRGQHVTYTHYLTNRGNCAETVRAGLDFLADSKAGWTSAAYIDNRTAGGGSVPGVVDATDVRVQQGWTQVLQPGESLRILVDVHAPGSEAIKAAIVKALVDSDITTLVVTSASSGPLVVKDTTLIDGSDVPGQPDNAIRNFTDGSYAMPTVWGVIGRDLFLRADAAACNANPAAIESRTVVITGPNGEREELTAVESGADTGIFVVPALHIRTPPVAAGDGFVEGAPNDVFEFEILGCGRRIANVVTLMNATSIVFDSRTNDPIAGATVTLLPATAGQCSTKPAVFPAASNPAITAADGSFSFPATSGDYCLAVKAPNGYRFPSQVPYTLLSPARNLNVTGLTTGGSYGNAFHVPAGGFVVVDIPLDTAAQDGLFVQKEASRQVAELGDFVDYTVRVRNGTGNALDRADVLLTDNLPAGFAYVKGSARRDGVVIADPAGGGGPRLTLVLGHLDRGAQAAITYRVRIGPGAMQGDGVNRVQATYSVAGITTASNIASAKVQVTGGVFSDKGFILGKVFMDCNANGVQDKGEEGVPGVRVLLEDGTYIVSDGAGKFSFYGLSNRTHVAKVDRATLPSGAMLETISSRNLGDAGSRIVDLKAGELARADFAIAGCDAGVVAEVQARAKAVARTDELTALAGAQLLTEARVITDVKALPASGVVEIAAAGAMPGATTPTAAPTIVGGGFNAVIPAQAGIQPSPAPRLPHSDSPPAAVTIPLEALVPGFADNSLAFVGIADGQTLPYAQSVVRVKGAAETTFKLKVNGDEMPDSRVGKRSVLAEKQVQAWEFVGIEMRPGENTLVVTQLDAFGNVRGTAAVKVIAPDKLGKLVIEVPAAGGIADGKSAVRVIVKLADAKGVPVTVRTPVTLAATRGIWQAEDLDPKEPGVQVFVEGGVGEFFLTPPLEPGESRVYVASGPFKAEARLDFLPELRNMIASGVIEGVVNMRNISTRALTPARASDGFEQELRHLSRQWSSGKSDGGVRAAFYLKGKIRGEYLLTAAYDSDKDTQERLFRDIQPDEFYPVYGDSAVRGFDAQSTSKLYVRIDKARSYLLWGDFNTNAPTDTRKLTNYSRSLTGIKEHYENSHVSVNAFASRDTTRQVIEELRANGTSGPFQLGTPGALVNSEKIEIITRDRNQPAIIVSSVPQARFSDYEIEALTGRILFKAPIPSVDSNLNPVSVRITYEVDQGGPEFWVAGVDAQVKLGDRVEVGGIYVKDKNPLAPFTLAGADMVVKLGAATYVIAEAARSTSGLDDVKGNAGRLEIKHESTNVKAQAFVAHTDRGFENPGSYLSEGRSEAGGKLEYKLSERTTIRAEALRTEDVASGSVRDGATASIQYKLADKLTLELGVRHASEKGTLSPVPALPPESLTGLATSPTPVANPGEVDTVRVRITGEVPYVKGATVYGEAEVDVRDADRKIIAAGGEYALANKGRIYARHEFISSITGPYGLNPTERQNTTAVGIDTEYMKDGRAYSEYRIRDAISGGDVEAAFGLKNLWSIAPGLRLGTTFERVHTLAGTGVDENTAIALALEYTANPDWKASSRLEYRDGSNQDQLLFTVGLAARLNRDWTALARNAYTLMRNKTGGAEHLIDRMQAGLAWRDNDTNRWNVLARVESRVENDDTQLGMELRNSTQIVSVHADWQPKRPFLVTGRYAAKWAQDKSNGLSTRYRAQVVGGRFTWEFAPKWDVGLVSSALFGTTADSRQYGVGLELGYLVATNLWVSAGYNFFGYKDVDLAGADYTAKGAYVRLRYKFDENVFGAQAAPSSGKAAIPSTATLSSESREGNEVRAPETAPAGGFVPLTPSGASATQRDGGGPL